MAIEPLKRAVHLIGGQTATAKAVGRGIKQSHVYKWLNSPNLALTPPAEYCPALERATAGLVRCEDLRPDVEWGVLRKTPALDPHPPTRHCMCPDCILRAQCEELGYLPPIPRLDVEVSDAALLETYTRLMSELGDFSREFHLALADGKLTLDEIQRMESEMLEFMAAGEQLIQRARQIAEV